MINGESTEGVLFPSQPYPRRSFAQLGVLWGGAPSQTLRHDGSGRATRGHFRFRRFVAALFFGAQARSPSRQQAPQPRCDDCAACGVWDLGSCPTEEREA